MVDASPLIDLLCDCVCACSASVIDSGADGELDEEVAQRCFWTVDETVKLARIGTGICAFSHCQPRWLFQLIGSHCCSIVQVWPS